MRAIEFLQEVKEPRKIAYKMQVGNYLIPIDVHLLVRMEERNVPKDEVMSTINKLPKAKAKIKNYSPGERFYLHDNTNDLYVLFITVNPERKIYIAKTVWNKPMIGGREPIIQVA
jgi:hypothetical protein